MKIVSFEGIDGAGKTTQTRLQYDRLEQEGLSVGVYSYSNKNNRWGRIIRRMYTLDAPTPFDWFFRRRGVQEVLYSLSARHNLKESGLSGRDVVISDRSIVTAYASHIDQVPEWFISFVEPSFVPNLVVFLDVQPQVGLERISGRDQKFKDEDLESLIKFRNLYMRIMFDKRPRKLEQTEFVVVDAARSLEEVTAEVTALLDKKVVHKLKSRMHKQ